MCRLKGLPVPRSVSSHRFARRGVARRLLGIAVLLLLATVPAFSQQGTRSGKPAAPSPTGNTDPAGNTDQGATADPARPPVEEASPADAAAPEPTDEAPPAPDAPLPDYFVPPAARPAFMTDRKPLMTTEEIHKEDGALRLLRVDRVLSGGETGNANAEIVRRWADLRIAELTAVDDWTKIGELTSAQILLPLRNAALRQSNPNRVREFREMLCKAVADACSRVLDNNFYVRMQAVRILSELNVREKEVTGTSKPAVSYVPAMEPLLSVIDNPEQPESLKVLAAVGIARVADAADIVPAELKFKAADILTKELAKPDHFWWYDMRLADAAAAIEFEIDRTGQPIVVDTLLSVIADGNRSCMARTAAAKALGRTPVMAGKFDDKAAADRIAKLARDMSLAYNKNPGNVQWYHCFLNLQLTFKPNAGEDVAGLPQNSLIRTGSLPAPLDNVEQRILPLAKHVLNQPVGKPHKPIPAELIQRLAEVLAAANTP
jgi:hypothetical protein